MSSSQALTKVGAGTFELFLQQTAKNGQIHKRKTEELKSQNGGVVRVTHRPTDSQKGTVFIFVLSSIPHKNRRTGEVKCQRVSFMFLNMNNNFIPAALGHISGKDQNAVMTLHPFVGMKTEDKQNAKKEFVLVGPTREFKIGTVYTSYNNKFPAGASGLYKVSDFHMTMVVNKRHHVEVSNDTTSSTSSSSSSSSASSGSTNAVVATETDSGSVVSVDTMSMDNVNDAEPEFELKEVNTYELYKLYKDSDPEFDTAIQSDDNQIFVNFSQFSRESVGAHRLPTLIPRSLCQFVVEYYNVLRSECQAMHAMDNGTFDELELDQAHAAQVQERAGIMENQWYSVSIPVGSSEIIKDSQTMMMNQSAIFGLPGSNGAVFYEMKSYKPKTEPAGSKVERTTVFSLVGNWQLNVCVRTAGEQGVPSLEAIPLQLFCESWPDLHRRFGLNNRLYNFVEKFVNAGNYVLHGELKPTESMRTTTGPEEEVAVVMQLRGVTVELSGVLANQLGVPVSKEFASVINDKMKARDNFENKDKNPFYHSQRVKCLPEHENEKTLFLKVDSDEFGGEYDSSDTGHLDEVDDHVFMVVPDLSIEEIQALRELSMDEAEKELKKHMDWTRVIHLQANQEPIPSNKLTLDESTWFFPCALYALSKLEYDRQVEMYKQYEQARKKHHEQELSGHKRTRDEESEDDTEEEEDEQEEETSKGKKSRRVEEIEEWINALSISPRLNWNFPQ